MRKTGFFIFIFIFFVLIQLSSIDNNLQIDLYNQGNDLFRQAVNSKISNPEEARSLYEDSLLRFLQIIENTQNGKLYYNIGNIYFHLGDIGRAILYYKKAALLIPGDRNLKENLSFAREQRVDTLNEKESSRILETIFFLHYNLSGSFKAVLFEAAFALSWISAAFLLLRGKLHVSLLKIFFTTTIFFSAVALLSLGSLFIDTLELKLHPAGVITADAIIARKGDGLSYSPSFKDPLHSGLEFTLINERPGWYYIELNDNTRAWIPDKAAALVQLD